MAKLRKIKTWAGYTLIRQEELARFKEHMEELVAERSRQLLEANASLTLAKEKAEEGSRMKSAFLANMSHELRTPMNAILLYSDLLAEDPHIASQPETLDDLRKIQQAGKHLLSLIDDILDLSKIEAGKIALYIESTDIRALLQDITTATQPLVAKNRNCLEVVIAEGIDRLHTDPTRLRQVLINLLSNAFKFTSDGTITLRVEPDPDPAFVLFSVQDTGIGMTPEQVGLIFQEFVQADDSTTRRFGGTGLGLALSRRFAEMLGGRIWVDSVEGQGSVFFVRIPRNSSAYGSHKPQVQAPSTPPVSGRVLIIEDDDGLRDSMARTLAKEGFEVHSAATGEQGLAMALELHPQLITLDVGLPGIDGWQVINRLKENPELKDTPVVLVTQLPDSTTGFAMGVRAILQKPVSPKDLITVTSNFAKRTKGMPVLVVEDDVLTSEGLIRVLNREGWQARGAKNGMEAMASMAKDPPALIVLDLMMPEMDGFQLLAELQENAAWRDIPTVVLTAKELTAEDLGRLQASHVRRILHKGDVSKQELTDTVRKLATEWYPNLSQE